MSPTEPTVTRNETKHRYEIAVDGEVVGFTEFTGNDAGEQVFFHTEIDPGHEGEGLGSILVGAALADVADRGQTLVPRCSFVARYVQTHEVPGLHVAPDRRNG